jgi:hypothetical protein
MKDCCEAAKWVVIGGGITANWKSVMLILGACDEHVLPVKNFVNDHSMDFGEPAVVVSYDAFQKVLAPKGFQIDQLVAHSA